MGTVLLILFALVGIGVAIGIYEQNNKKRIAATELDRYVNLCNSSLHTFDNSSDLAIKFREYALLEKYLKELLRIAPYHQGARQLEQMMPEVRRKLEAAEKENSQQQTVTTKAGFHDYGIDMSGMQAQVQAAEKSMYQSMQKQQQASAINDQWLQLQKIAYTMVGPSVTAEEKKRFTQQMTEFAKEDPLYNEVMARLIPLVQANPGITQSKLYKGEPDHIKEQMRYVLYFASELGHIRRVKKGNSYELYPPNMV